MHVHVTLDTEVINVIFSSVLDTYPMNQTFAASMVHVLDQTLVNVTWDILDLIVPFQFVMESWPMIHQFVIIIMVLAQLMTLVHAVLHHGLDHNANCQFVTERLPMNHSFVVERVNVSFQTIVNVPIPVLEEAHVILSNVLEVWQQIPTFVVDMVLAMITTVVHAVLDILNLIVPSQFVMDCNQQMVEFVTLEMVLVLLQILVFVLMIGLILPVQQEMSHVLEQDSTKPMSVLEMESACTLIVVHVIQDSWVISVTCCI